MQQPALRAALRPRLFELDLLIALRQRELAIDADPALERARAADLPDAIQAARYLEIAAAIPPDARGTPVRDRRTTAASRPAWVQESRAWLDTAGALPLLRDYLTATLACLPPALPLPPPDNGDPAPSDPPLVSYRRSLCGNRIDAARLEQVFDAEPRFVETALFLARTQLGTDGSLESARVRERLWEAFERMPRSLALAHQAGATMTALRDHRAAAEYYSAALALADRHEEARLGRGVAFAYLDRGDEAIADLSILIDEAAPRHAEAYYWRAWIHHRRSALAPARADIERAKALSPEPHVFTLAGIIEHDQRDLDVAGRDLTRAVGLDPEACTAYWYLGLVAIAGERWPDGAGAFGRSSACYARSAAENERRRDVIARRENLTPEFRARQIASFEAAVAEDRSQESAAAFNAAVNYARAGDRVSAMRYLEQAETDDARREAGQALRKAMAETLR